ncbi:MAG: PQQ-binding-like beta-propeller repeat protein [Sinobacteraceae bacterium]|nr:PQQ-binding-like beta-propeller repeat protein [Nevskiaceae bacterium]MBV9317197.1 PQQ-binding-like beta-propeller repeat protein [Gammaproteobacteria bacterium]
MLAAVLLGAPDAPQVAAEASTREALPRQGQSAPVTRAAIRFSDLAEVTAANVRGLLPLVARSVALVREQSAADAAAAVDLPLQRFVEERTHALDLSARGRGAAHSNGLNSVVSYLLESDATQHSSTGAAPRQVAGRELRAWDPIARHVLWSVHEALPISSGTLITAGGLVFYGTDDGWFKALDARTGETLWKHRADGRRLAEPASYRGADGHQYIAVRALPRTPLDGGETVLLFALAH